MNTLEKIIEAKDFDIFKINEIAPPVSLTYITTPIGANFPSPAADYEEDRIDLIKELIKNPLYTYIMKAKGVSMQKANIFDGDILLIDTCIEPDNFDICVCSIDGDFTLKEINRTSDRFRLLPYNDNYPPIEITVDNRFMIWGILTWSIHKQFKRNATRRQALRNR